MQESVLAIVLDKSGKRLLAVKRRDVPVWVLPGGGIDPGETPETAALREVFEEAGITASIERLGARYTPVNALTRLTYVYVCRTNQVSPAKGEESADVGFFPLDKLPSPFFHVHEEWMRECLSTIETIQKPISNVTYGKLALYFCKHPIRVMRMLLSRWGLPLNRS